MKIDTLKKIIKLEESKMSVDKKKKLSQIIEGILLGLTTAGVFASLYLIFTKWF